MFVLRLFPEYGNDRRRRQHSRLERHDVVARRDRSTTNSNFIPNTSFLTGHQKRMVGSRQPGRDDG